MKTQDYLESVPGLIYAATGLMVLTYVTFTVAVWPVWGFLSLVITTTNLIALFLLPTFLPDFLCGGSKRGNE